MHNLNDLTIIIINKISIYEHLTEVQLVEAISQSMI